MSTDNGKLEFYLVCGFGLGLFSFFKGFRVYREYRLLKDTPEIPIRSIPMGLVHIHGKAKGDQTVTSPVSHTPCYFYKVEIEKWKSGGSSGKWSHYRTDAFGVKFYLEDSSGRVLVDARDAEYDLVQSCAREVGGGWSRNLWRRFANQGVRSAPFTTAGMPAGATDDELLRYVNNITTSQILSFIEGRLAGAAAQSGAHKEQPSQAAPEMLNRPLGSPELLPQTTGASQVERRPLAGGPERDHQRELARLAALEACKHPFGSPAFIDNMRRAQGMIDDPEGGRQFLSGVDSMMHLRTSALGSPGLLPPASGRFRFKEYCILPDYGYDIIGTCVENPSPKDDHDRNLILKGENEPTFLISSKTEKELEGSLRNRAAYLIFGGAGLAIVCLGILLAKFGLF